MRAEEPPPTIEPRTETVPTVYVVIGVIIFLLLGILTAVGVIWAATNYPLQLEAIRDVFIIALALESCLFGIVLMLMFIMLIRLVNTVEFEIKPVLEQTNETIGTVRGTARFVSKNVVDPVVRVRGYAAGFRRGYQALLGDPKKNLPD